MIAPARRARIGEPGEARRQTFDHAARLPSPRTGNGQHHRQSAADPTIMREPWGGPPLLPFSVWPAPSASGFAIGPGTVCCNDGMDGPASNRIGQNASALTLDGGVDHD